MREIGTTTQEPERRPSATRAPIGRLPHYDALLDAQALVPAIAECLDTDRTLPGVIVRMADDSYRAISRANFARTMRQMFTEDIFRRRRIEELLRTAPSSTLMLAPETEVCDAVDQALARPEATRFDPVILATRPTPSMLDMNDLMQCHLAEVRRDREHLVRQQRELSDALGAKQQFLSLIEREVRTPANNVIGFAELLKSGAPHMQSDEIVEYLGDITRNARLLQSMILDLVDYADLGVIGREIKPVPTDWRQWIAKTLERVQDEAHAKSLKLHTLVPDASQPALPQKLNLDEPRLTRVLLALLSNAIKFTDAGSITLELALQQRSPRRWCLQIAVVDTGRGIDEDKLKAIYAPFDPHRSSDTVRRGLGLGLALARGLVSRMGGTIDVESKPNVGSRFVVTLEGLTEPNDQTRPADLGRLRGKRVLVIDDAADNRRLLEVILGRAGVDVRSCANGRAGLDEASEASVQGRGFDLILTDLEMPVLDGHGLVRELVQRFAEVPVVALTSHATTRDRQLCLDAGCRTFLTKPILPDRLLTALAGVLDESRGAVRPARMAA